jgi:hypothetical protein
VSGSIYRGGFAFVLGSILLVGLLPAAAAADPYILEPIISLTGDCQPAGAPIDPVPDPGCPGGTHPPSGRFNEPRSVAIDSYGNEYVASYAFDGTKGRIDVFDDEGNFITEVADPLGPNSVAIDSKGNLYVFERVPGADSAIARYTPSVYEPNVGNIQYKNPRQVIITNSKFRNGLAIDSSNDHLYLAQGVEISEYSSAVEGNKLLHTFTHPSLNASTWAAVDGKRRRLFASFEGTPSGILVFEADPPFNLLEKIDGSEVPAGEFVSTKGWTSIAVNEETGHLFVDDLEASQRVYEFDENYQYFATVENGAFQGGNALQIAIANNPLNKENRNFEYLFVPVLFGSTRVLAFKPPAEREPKVESLKAINVAETEAEIEATIDPEGGNTEYTLEVEGPGLEGPQLIAQGVILGTALPQQVGSLISGLEPGAEYSFRAVAENKVGDDEKQGTFTTYSDAVIPIEPPCPNQVLRSGPSAALPDCRAYELVTPSDTNGRPTRGAGFEGDRFGAVQASPLGGTVSFELTGGLPPGSEGTGGFHGDPFRASRSTSGWSTVLTGPTGSESSQPKPASFSPDQGYSFWAAGGEGSAIVGGLETHYIRYPDGHSELVGRGSLGIAPRAGGTLIVEGGTHIVFATSTQLEPNAAATGINAIYDRTADEVTHVVSLMPGDVTPTKGSNYLGASADGLGIAFSIEGTLYLRLNNAATFQIGTKGAKFAGVSEEGRRVFYVEGGDLKAFDTATEAVVEFTETGDTIPVNVSPQGNRAYFVSEEVIPSSGLNPNGAEPLAGKQNLYRSDEGAISFVATVTDRDVEGIETGSGKIDGLGLWTLALGRRPATDPSRVTADGEVFLFQSRANLVGYDVGGLPQVYRYDSGAEELICLSCPPTKQPATGGAALQTLVITDVAAPFSQYGFVPNLRADGKRIFFESTEALVSSDTNGVRDVYEWEEEGVGRCTRGGGCIYLISSGHSARNNYLFGHSASGDDVFFTTGEVLVPGDEETVSVYDARVNGGFAQPQAISCFEEGCKPPMTPPPVFPNPGEDSGPGNITPQKPAKKCPKGKRRVKRHGKTVCVKRHKRHHRSGTKRH